MADSDPGHLRYPSKDDCPDKAKLHTKSPDGGLSYAEWTDKKSKTHVQERCPTCGYWSVWVPKKAKK